MDAENITKARLWRALFIIDIFEECGKKWETLLQRYRSHGDPIIRNLARQNVEIKKETELYSIFENGIVSDLESLNLLEQIVSIAPPSGISQFCLKNLYQLQSRLVNHEENRSKNHQNWKIFKHLANTVGKFPEPRYSEEIFEFFFNEFTTGVYRNDFDLTRDSNGFGIFCQKSAQTGNFSESWVERSLGIFSRSDFDLTSIPLFNSASLPHLFWGLANSDRNRETSEKIILGLLEMAKHSTNIQGRAKKSKLQGK